jgi:hypothetical protein
MRLSNRVIPRREGAERKKETLFPCIQNLTLLALFLSHTTAVIKRGGKFKRNAFHLELLKEFELAKDLINTSKMIN